MQKENLMKIKIENVRLSFPSLFRKAQFNGAETKYEATFLLSKTDHAKVISQIDKAIKEKIAGDLKGAKIGADKLCLRDGDDVDYDGYEGHMSLKASNKKRPLVIGKDKSPLTEDDSGFMTSWMISQEARKPLKKTGLIPKVKRCSRSGCGFSKRGKTWLGASTNPCSTRRHAALADGILLN